MAERITKVHQMGSFSHTSATDWSIMFSNSDIQNVFKALIDDRSCAEIESIQFNLYTNVTCDNGYATVYTTVAFVNSASNGNNSSKRKYVGEISSYRTDKNPTQSGSFDLTSYFNANYPFAANGNTGGYNNLCIYFDTTSMWEKNWKITSMNLTVKYKDEHTIKVEISPPNTGTVTGAGTYTHTHSAQLGVTPNNGYHTNYWNKNSSKITDSDGKNSISVKVEGNDTYTAVLQGNQYTVKYDGNGATGGSTVSTTHIYGTASNLRANGFSRNYTVSYDASGGSCNTNSNVATYSFANWNTSADGKGTTYGKQASISTLVTSGSKTLYAQWNSASVTLPTPTRAGYTFNGWYTSAGIKIGNAGASYTPTANITLYAHWTAISDINYENLFSLSNWLNSASSTLNGGSTNYDIECDNVNGSIKIIDKSGGSTDTFTPMSGSGIYTIPVEIGKTYVFKCDIETNGTARPLIFATNSSLNDYTSVLLDKRVGTGEYKWTFVPTTNYIHFRFGTVDADNIYAKYSNIQVYKQSREYLVERIPVKRQLITLNSLQSLSKTGYTFNGWYDNENLTGSAVTLSWAQSRTTGTTIYSKWTDHKIIFTYYGNNGQSTPFATWEALISQGWPDNHYNYSSGDKKLTRTGYLPQEYIDLDGKKSIGSYIDDKGNTVGEDQIFDNYQELCNAHNVNISDQTTSRSLYAQWKPIDYIIRFDSNTGIGTMSELSMKYDQSKNLTACTFKKTGYTFQGWSRDKNATSITYSDGQSVSNLATEQGAEVTLYAVWKANEYTIIYYGNGNTGGSTASSNHIYDQEKELTENGFERIYHVIYNPNKGQCSINTNSAAYEFLGWKDSNENEYSNKEIVLNLTAKKESFHLYAQWGEKSVTLPIATRIGYTFDGWYTSDNKFIGMDGDEFIPNSNTELIAHWEEHTYTIIFNGNSGNGFMQSIVVDYSQEITLPEIGFTKLGYHFTGWITADNRPDEPYKSGSIISKLTAIDNDTIEFITTWAPNKYKIEFVKKEDYSGDMDVLDITYDDQNDYFPPNKFSKKGYIFQGWSTSSLGNKVDYEIGDEIPNLSTTENSTVYIYAVWKPIVYSITFDGNGSTSGEMNDIIDPILYDEEIQLPDVRYEKFGYDFIGWLSSEGGEIIKQNTVKNLTDKNDHRVTLYAQWKQRKYTIIWENVADGENRTTEEYSNIIPQYSTIPWKSYTDEMHFIFVDWDRPIELLGNEEDGAIIRYKAIFNSEKHEHTQIDVIDPIGANPGYTRHTCPIEECGHYYNDTITWRVIFLEYDETELSNEILNEFEEIFPPSSYIPIETSMDTAREDYYFNGWTKKPGYGYDDGNYIGNSNSEKWMEGANARSNLVYQATYDYHIKTYPVSWYDGDGKLIYYQANVPYGNVPTQPSIIPTKTSTSTEVFSFEYWKLEGASEDGIIQVQGPQNYYAQFSSGVRTYTVIWKNPGVEEPLYVETGIKFKEKVPKYEGDPAKLVHPNEGDPLYTYEFVGWSTEIIDHIPEDSEQDFPDDEELPLVTGDVIYTAVYKKKYQIYNIRARILYQDDEIWINYEDSYYSDEIYLNAYFYGKPAGYTFLQWDDGNKNVIRKIIVEEDKDYKAEYIPNYYTVKWVGYKNNVLKSEQLPYKTKPDPTEVEQMDALKKPYDDKYHYEFDGWEIMRGSVNEKGEILGDVIYRAIYKTKEHQWSETEFNFVIDEGYAEAKRYCTCENCDEWEEHYDRAVVTLTSRVLKGEEVSCDKDGYLTYFASFKDDWNGLVTKKVVIKQTGHLWSDTQRIGKNYDEKGWHYKVCLRCNQAEASVHNWDEGKVDNSNACIDGGVKKFKCRDKGCDGVYHIGMPPGKHKDFISTPGREPTCEEDGNEPYKQCIVCKLFYPEEADANNTPGKFSNSSFIKKALGHAYNKIVHTIIDENTGEVIDLRADCTNSGVVRQICDHGCGIDRIINVPPRKHNWGEVMVDRESTCTENGVGICQCMNTETDYYKKCEGIKSIKLPLKPHTPDIIKNGIPPTCTEKGESDKIICSVCLKTLQDAYEIPALGHHFISKSLIPEENTLRREVLNVCTRKGCNHRYGLYFSD